MSEPFTFTIKPRTLTFDGELYIADKFYDGNDIIKRSDVIVPTINETDILASDKGQVNVNWDFTDTKYPSAEVKYTDDTNTEVAAYENIPVSVSLTGRKAKNYVLQTDKFYASSKIKPFDYSFTYNLEPENPNDDVKTFRVKYGQSILGVDFKVDMVTINNQALDMTGKYVRYLLILNGVEYDRTLLMQRPNDKDDEYFDIDVQVVEGDREADMLKETVDIVCHQKIKLHVYKYKLEVSPPDVITDKVYDGNTSVKWKNGNNCVITNAVDGDDVKLDGEPVISYDTPDVGRHKVISVHYNLIGNHLNRYILPDDIVLEGQILKKGGVDEVEIQTITPSVSPAEGGYCSGDDVVINVKFKEGVVDYCNLLFDEQAKKVGFNDLYNIELQSLTDDLYQLTFKCPNATYGTYSAKLQMIDPIDGHTKDTDKFEFKVNYSSDYLQSKYKNVGYDGDVLVIKNLDTDYFVEYQWYKTPFEDNDVFASELRGETKQFLYETPYLRGLYAASMVTVNGEKVKVCPKWFGPKDVPLSKSVEVQSVLVYPNPASSMEPVTIRLNGFDTDGYSGVNILIYNNMGSLVLKLTDVDELNTVVLPSGNYSGVVAVDGKTIPFKFIVRN